MLQYAISTNQRLIAYMQRLMADIPDERLTEQPLPGVNHPAWILGHLALVGDAALSALSPPESVSKVCPPTWSALFGMGSLAVAERDQYPGKDELVSAVEQTYGRARELAATVPTANLQRPHQSKSPRPDLPTQGDMVNFIMTGHLGMHLGQLSAWRRMIGKAPLF